MTDPTMGPDQTKKTKTRKTTTMEDIDNKDNNNKDDDNNNKENRNEYSKFAPTPHPLFSNSIRQTNLEFAFLL